MRLIDADALIALIKKRLKNTAIIGWLCRIISEVPTIEAEPVRHGRWVHTDFAAHWNGKDECSECTYHEKDRRDLSHLNYCPNCGAKCKE